MLRRASVTLLDLEGPYQPNFVTFKAFQIEISSNN